jgi:hypothetical protein
MKCILKNMSIGLILLMNLANAQAQNLSDERRKAVLDFSLTMERANNLITAMEAMTKYVVSLPDYAERLRKQGQMTLAEQTAVVEKDPRAMDIVKKNNLTAREYLVGVVALRMALLSAGGTTSPNIVASPANVAFAKANMSVLKPKMDAADGIAAPQRK